MGEPSDFSEFEVVMPVRAVTITLEIGAADVELALASDGANLRRPLMAALYAAMAVERGTITTRI